MSQATTRDNPTQLPEFRQLLKVRTHATLPCDGGSEWTSDDPRQQTRAAQLCQSCGALRACRAYALAADERTGVWGGLTELDRKRLRRRETAA